MTNLLTELDAIAARAEKATPCTVEVGYETCEGRPVYVLTTHADVADVLRLVALCRELDAWVEKLIEAGNNLDCPPDNSALNAHNEWRAIVEREVADG